MSDDEELPKIIVTPNGPLVIKGLKKLIGPDGKYMEPEPEMAFCRCGASKKKPSCDGSHIRIEFTGDPDKDRFPNRTKEYRGKELNVIDNRASAPTTVPALRSFHRSFPHGTAPG